MPKFHLEGSNRVYFILKVYGLEIIVLYMFVIHDIHILLLTASLNLAALKAIPGRYTSSIR